MTFPLEFKPHDGGRLAAGFRGRAGDCVCRSICIAAGLPYAKVYERLAKGNETQRVTGKQKRNRHKAGIGMRSAAHGIWTRRKWFRDYMAELGFVWTPTMQIGSGCTHKLRYGDLPDTGRLIVSLSNHYTTVIDGVIFDTYNPGRQGTRCVYGYWKLEKTNG